jgi:hypothetical protein
MAKIVDIMEVLALINEKSELESQYGSQSCFDYPKQYDRMEELTDEIYTEVLNISSFYANSIITTLEDILKEFDVNDISDINIQSFDKYCDSLEFNSEMSSLFYFIDIDTRKKFIEMNYLSDNEYIYTTKYLDYILEVTL